MYMYADCGVTKILIYVQFKRYITESIGLTKPTPNNIVTDSEPKLVIGLVSHKKTGTDTGTGEPYY